MASCRKIDSEMFTSERNWHTLHKEDDDQPTNGEIWKFFKGKIHRSTGRMAESTWNVRAVIV